MIVIATTLSYHKIMIYPLFRKVDAVLVRVPSLEEGIGFYSRKLGHAVLWRRKTMVALKMGQSDTELVLSTELNPETDLLVESVQRAVLQITAAGGKLIFGPSEIEVGELAVVEDPFGNNLTLVDLTKSPFTS